MGARARNRPLYAQYAFMVDDLSRGITEAKFSKADGIRMTINIGEHAEGGAQAPMKEATTAAFENASFEHGVFNNEEIYSWVLECIDMLRENPYGAGVESPEQLRNFLVRQLKRNRDTLFRVPLYNAQPAAFSPGTFDNKSSEIQVESLELAYEYFDKVLE